MVRRARPGPERITVDVETLVLDDVPAGQRARVVAVFERELVRLLRERGPEETSRGAVRAGPELPAGGTPERLGVALARSVHGALTSGDQGTAARAPGPMTARAQEPPAARDRGRP
jgi:hypothetical protein